MQAELAPVISLLRRDIAGLAALYLFGSQATGTAHASSDVDLALLAGRPLDRGSLLDVRERVSALLNREADLIDLAAADTILQMQVLRDGKLIAALDPVVTGLFELRVLRDYRDLKRRRAGIEADIVKRGRVHA